MDTFILSQTLVHIGDLNNIDNNTLKKICLKHKNFSLKKRAKDETDTLSEDCTIPYHKELKKVIEKLISMYKDKFKINLKLDQFWGHIHEKNHSTNLHNHVNPSNLENSAVISGVYYVYIPKKSGKIVFDYNINQYETRRYWFQPVTGRYLLFPSYLNHFVTRNLDNEERISISFNFKLEK